MKEEPKDRGSRPEHRPVNKATMDQPQEEFVADQSAPAPSDEAKAREQGDEIEGAPGEPKRTP